METETNHKAIIEKHADTHPWIAMLFPLLFVAAIWIVKAFELWLDVSYARFGVYPGKASGLIGIVASPFLHSGFRHLFNNSLPLLVLGWALFYFYRIIAFRVLLLIMLMSGFWLWIGGREAYHIGASGIIYGLATFLFFSGIMRQHIPLMALSMLVAFLYGSMVWYIFPYVDNNISWEAHLMGSIAGIALAFYYKNEGPQKPPLPQWLEADDDDPETTDMQEDRDESN